MNYNHLGIQTYRPSEEWDRHSPRETLQYAIGALLYTPADHKGIGGDICSLRYPGLRNIVFCLEDSILDNRVEAAEQQLMETIEKIHSAVQSGELSAHAVPLLLIRVRSAEQMLGIYHRLGSRAEMITGFVLPKFSASKAESYREGILEVNRSSSSVVYLLPIIESAGVIRRETRIPELSAIKAALGDIRDFILNVRVGGNDFCNIYGLRRGTHNTIYDISVVRDVLTDILNMFSEDYVVSAPVWEYFGGAADQAWLKGLQAELALDKLNGFIGKTAIHPCQLEAIQAAHVVDKSDYVDALSILHWENEGSGVAKSPGSMRMNEVKIHQRWAGKVLALAHVYGVKE